MQPIDIEALYKEVCLNIRETDNISFRLLRVTPLFAGFGSGILTYFLNANESPNNMAIIALCLLSLVGFGLTLGIFVWEKRNLQKCDWFICRARELEAYMINGKELTSIQFTGWDDENWKEDFDYAENNGPKLKAFGIKASKTKGENIVYIVSILAWLVPIITYVLVNLSICLKT